MALERIDRNTARKKIQEGEFPTLQNTKTNENYTSITTAQQRIKEWQNLLGQHSCQKRNSRKSYQRPEDGNDQPPQIHQKYDGHSAKERLPRTVEEFKRRIN